MSKYIFLLLLVLFVGILAVVNTTPHFLMGWDNLLFELNIWVNIKRAIFSVWQEHQGVGTLAGNGHATALPYQFLLAILLLLFPQELVRQIFLFGMLLSGSIGAYFLIRK